jgi:hypothetical protein
MDDELDTRLEASLRLALHGEADALPLLVREQDVEGARRARRNRRLALPAALVGAAAVLALLVVTGMLTLGDRSGVGATPSPSPTLPPLATYDELLALMGPGAVPLLRGEHDVDADAIEVDLGVLPAGASLAYGVSCLGGSIDIIIVRAGAEIGTNRPNCSIKPYVTWVQDLSALGRPPLDGTEHVVVRSSGGVRWRVLVAESSLPAPSVIVIRPTATPPPSPSLPAVVVGETPLVVVQVAGNGRGRPGEPVATGVDATTFDQVVVTGACVGDGVVDIAIDGAPAQYPCAAFGPDVFLRDADTWLTIRAVATGAARFVLRVSAWTPSSG